MICRRTAESCVIMMLAIALVSQAQADITFRARLDASQVVGGSSSTAFGIATFVLDTAEQNLSYELRLNGLDLIENPADRTTGTSVDKIHLHNASAGGTGPHLLNIFGIPSEDDDQLIVDFAAEQLTGNWDDSDAFDDQGMLFDQFNPGTTKLFSNFVDDLKDGQIYIAVHSIGQGGGVAIRGQILAVPEPATAVVVFNLMAICTTFRRPRQKTSPSSAVA